ncbi:MAG: NAD(P)-dependent oxidoreductase [Bacteroidetes bacterium]|nr:NAD(P)-dependent oxidoreductase [Bacteroidota bacterium]
MDKKVLITGASGFIGSFLTEGALKRGYRVIAGIRPTSNRQYLADPRMHLLEMDFSSVESLTTTLSGLQSTGLSPDFLIHNAGITRARRREDFFHVNAEFTGNLVQAIEKCDLKLRKFLFMSSLAASGPGNEQTQVPIRITDPPSPVENYGKSKLAAEQIIRETARFPWIILRPTGVYGPHEKDYYNLYRMISRGVEPYLITPDQQMSLIYIEDLVKVVFLALESQIENAVYLVSDGNTYSSRQFSTAVKSALGARTISFTVPGLIARMLVTFGELQSRLFHATPLLSKDKYAIISRKNWLCDVSPLKDELGFQPDFTIDSGLPVTLEWYRNNNLLK